MLGKFQRQLMCSRSAELTHSRRRATCPLLLDSMKVARHTRATYGVLRAGHRATGGSAVTSIWHPQTRLGEVLWLVQLQLERRKKMLILPNISSFMSDNHAHESQNVHKVRDGGVGGSDWCGVKGRGRRQSLLRSAGQRSPPARALISPG